MNQLAAKRAERLHSLTEAVAYFDYNNPTHIAHLDALTPAFGELNAASLVSQDARANGDQLEITDAGAVNSWYGWKKLNRVVRHSEKARYTIYDTDARHLIPIFTREQTVPAYAQPY